MLVWHHGSALQPCKCPLCRRNITLLIPTEASLQLRHDPTVSEILRKVEMYNRTFGGRSDGLIQRMQDLPFFLRRLARELMDPDRSLPFIIRARVYISVSENPISFAIFLMSCSFLHITIVHTCLKFFLEFLIWKAGIPCLLLLLCVFLKCLSLFANSRSEFYRFCTYTIKYDRTCWCSI